MVENQRIFSRVPYLDNAIFQRSKLKLVKFVYSNLFKIDHMIMQMKWKIKANVECKGGTYKVSNLKILVRP